jgi:hypothetical protein
MDFTTSDANITHVATGQRMHQDTAPVTTAVTAKDMNQVIWSLMKLLQDAGISAAAFDPANPATYNRVSQAVQAFAVGGLGPHLAAADPHTQYGLTTQGTFLPELTFGGASTGIGYGDRSGWWSRTKNLVTFGAFLRLTSKGSATGGAKVSLTGLPACAYQVPAQASVDLITGLLGHVSGMLIYGGNVVEVRKYDPSTGEASMALDTNLTNTTHLYLTGAYMAS